MRSFRKALSGFLIASTLVAIEAVASTEGEFLKDSGQVLGLYESEIKKIDPVYVYFFDWNNSSLLSETHAISNQGKIHYFINMSGGIYRAIESRDAYDLLLCHEIGHILARGPRIEVGSALAAEGQADYFATNTCIKRVFDITHVGETQASKEMHIRLAIKHLANFLNSSTSDGFGRNIIGIKRKFSFPNGPIRPARQLIRRYPTLNCRVFTWIEGFRFSEGDESGRPKCWLGPDIVL